MEKKYLASNCIVDWQTSEVNQQAKALIEGLSAPKDKIAALFRFVRDEFPYTVITSMFTRTLLKASTTLRRRKGFCVNKAVLLAALCRAAGIPARLHFVTMQNHAITPSLQAAMGTNIFTYHGYTEVHLDGRWVKLTPAFDKALSERKGFPLVEWDGMNDALLPKSTLEGNKMVEYLADLGTSASVPVVKMAWAWFKLYAPAVLHARKSTKTTTKVSL